jgi:spore maturation protein SpmA
MKLWWSINIIWIVIIVSGAIYMMVRKVDGAGVVQTMPLRLVSLAILAVFAIFIALCQWLALYFIHKNQSAQ